MMGKKMIVGNLKMHLETLSMREAYLADAVTSYGHASQEAEVVICPPTLYMERFAQAFEGTHVRLGAQDCFWERHGSYTGYDSPTTLDSLGVEYVILGHSERRGLHESDETVARKCVAALRAHLTPIICVGYVQDGEDEIVAVTRQVQAILEVIAPEQYKNMLFAYEPVWCIGSGKTPTPQEIYTMLLLIRKTVGKFDEQEGRDMRVLYGGSVSPENVVAVGNESHVDGVLVGGASLHPENFARIIRNLTEAAIL